jgi:hypothetical protein
MNTRMYARDLAEEASHSLSKRIARFAMAINGCTAQMSQTRTQKRGRSNQRPNPNAGTRCPA